MKMLQNLPNQFREAISPYGPQVQQRLIEIRQLVFDTAASHPGVGQIEETLKWNQPSFLTTETGSGSTIRIDGLRNDRTRVGVFFYCQSGLVAQFRELYRDGLSFEKERAILLAVNLPLPKTELAHCISLALTHHLRKKTHLENGN